jgi:hypothetical protein
MSASANVTTLMPAGPAAPGTGRGRPARVVPAQQVG